MSGAVFCLGCLEVVRGAQGEYIWLQSLVLELQPVLTFELCTRVDMGLDPDVNAARKCNDVVGQIRDVVLKVEDTSPIARTRVGIETTVVTNVARPKLIGALVNVIVAVGIYLVEVELGTEMRCDIQRSVSGYAGEPLIGVVRLCKYKTTTRLKICILGGGREVSLCPQRAAADSNGYPGEGCKNHPADLSGSQTTRAQKAGAK